MVNKKIGQVKLNYAHYKGNDIYSDGSIEDVILNACMNNKEKELLYSSVDYAVLYHLSSIRENLIEWYPINKDESVLEIGSGCGAMTGILSEKSKFVTCVELSSKRSLINAYRHSQRDNIEILVGNFQDIEADLGKYDVITLIGVWEYSENYIQSEEPFLEMLDVVKRHLTPNGRLIIAIENKMGLKYWNGALEDHTGKQYSGLNDYVDDYDRKVRTFSKYEIEELFFKAHIEEYKFYYPMPDYKLPSAIYSDEYMPNIGELRTFKKDYSYAHVYNFNDAIVNDQICNDKMFHYFANSFLIICGNVHNREVFAKYNRERKKEFQTVTIIEKTEENKKIVRKRALSVNAVEHIKRHQINENRWIQPYRNLKCAVGEINKNEYVSGFIDGMSLEEILFQYKNKPDKLLAVLRQVIGYINFIDNKNLKDCTANKKFEEIFGEYKLGRFMSLEMTNVDLTASNIKLVSETDWVVFDSEWVFDFPIPYRFVTWRLCKVFYDDCKAYLKDSFDERKFFELLGFEGSEIVQFKSMEENFSCYVSGDNRIEQYTRNYEKPVMMQNTIFY